MALKHYSMMHLMNTDKTHREKARRQLHYIATNYWEQIMEGKPDEKTAEQPLT